MTTATSPEAASGTDLDSAPVTADRYVAPGRIARKFFNPAMARLTRLGIPVAGSRILAVRGRKSGEWRTTVLNPLPLDGDRYLVAPRGATAWVRNLRASGEGEIRVGRRAEAITATEVPDDAKVPVLRAYLERWGWEVGAFFQGVDKNATDDQLAAIAPGFPVFRIA